MVRRLALPTTALALVALSSILPLQASTVPDPVLDWNQVTFQALAEAKEGRVPPAARALAMVHTAIFDAVNAIDRRFAPYAGPLTAPAGASPEAAAAAAAHGVLVGLFPAQKPSLDAALAASMATVQAGTARADGAALGETAAARMLALRQADGWSAVEPYGQAAAPGVWQPIDGAVFVAMAKGVPFTLLSNSQFRPVLGPPALTSAEYTADFNEVKLLGSADSTVRTADQTEAALFWLESSQVTWHGIARTASAQKGLSFSENARLFAALTLAMADTSVASYDAKYSANFWRPIGAIRAADTDGNDATTADPTWTPLGAAPLPRHPDYISQHASVGGAAATVLASFLGTNDVPISFTTATAPNGAVRSYRGFSQAAAECASSRVWIGYHFRAACDDGLTMGRQVAHWVVDEYLQPVE